MQEILNVSHDFIIYITICFGMSKCKLLDEFPEFYVEVCTLVTAITFRCPRRIKVVHHNSSSVRLVLLSIRNKLWIKQIVCFYVHAFGEKRIINPLSGFSCRCFLKNNRH